MANTYTQLYFHIVFAVKGRKNLISKDWKEELYKYISGIIKNRAQKLMIVNGMPDHIHILIGTKPNCNLSDLVREIKSHSSKWINEKNFVYGKFQWQLGFGAFTVGTSELPRIIKYIENQEQHHSRKKFREEYIALLKKSDIEYKEEYIFDE